MDTAFWRSILLKGLYVVVASAAAGLLGWLQTNPDIGLWTLDTLKIALLTAVVAGLKKYVTSFFSA